MAEEICQTVVAKALLRKMVHLEIILTIEFDFTIKATHLSSAKR